MRRPMALLNNDKCVARNHSGFPNLYVDTTKKPCSDQATAVSELQVSCQNDLVHWENEDDVTGTATLLDTSVIKEHVKAEKLNDMGPDPKPMTSME
ncbi:hypothetical protein UY3_11359 [Chelonia mydas]|uniref:Uncharacterized protein n=1 Tax=Chelonia mydas TaxID=8469 RepID=M7B0X5_CHEMY|nr:hypothetical protein UY3_11359 [Chelonia mydas]